MNNREQNTAGNCCNQEAGAKPVELVAVVDGCACGSKVTNARANQVCCETAVTDGGIAGNDAVAVEGCCGNTSQVLRSQVAGNAVSCCSAADSAHASATVCGCNPNTNASVVVKDVKAEASADILNILPTNRDGAQRVHNAHPFIAQLKLRSNPGQPTSDSCCGGNSEVKGRVASVVEIDGLNAEQNSENENGCCINEGNLGFENFDISHESIIAGELALSIEERK